MVKCLYTDYDRWYDEKLNRGRAGREIQKIFTSKRG